MKSVRIAELKSKLSEYLRGVRKGQSVIVLDRETPIARIVPFDGENDRAPRLAIREPHDSEPLGALKPPRPVKGIDIVKLLLDERQTER